MIWWLYLIPIAVMGCWMHWRLKNRRMLAMAQKFPGPQTIPLLGNAQSFMTTGSEQFTRTLKEFSNKYGDIFRIWLGPDLNIFVSNPDYIKLLLSNSKTTFKGPQYKYMTELLSDGILSGSGPKWRKHRKLVTPNFSKRAIENHEELFNKEVDVLVDKLRTLEGEEFDAYKQIVRTTTYTVCQTMLGLTREETTKLPYFQEVIDETLPTYKVIFRRMVIWYLQVPPIYWMSPESQVLKNFQKISTALFEQIVRHGVEKLKTVGDDKDELLNTENDSDDNTRFSVLDKFLLSQEMNRRDLIGELLTIFTASQEATGKIASYLILMLAYHPECQEKLYEEIMTVIGEEYRHVSDDDLKQMPYLEMVFKEVIRLFPIGAMLQRTVTDDITLDKYTLPAGCSLVVPIFFIHRDPRFWTDPELFDPERFTPENIKNRNPNCYLPFSLGPMDCLGRYFGMKVVKTIAVKLIQQFKFTSSQTYDDLRISLIISVESNSGYPVSVTPRKKNSNI